MLEKCEESIKFKLENIKKNLIFIFKQVMRYKILVFCVFKNYENLSSSEREYEERVGLSVWKKDDFIILCLFLCELLKWRWKKFLNCYGDKCIDLHKLDTEIYVFFVYKTVEVRFNRTRICLEELLGLLESQRLKLRGIVFYLKTSISIHFWKSVLDWSYQRSCKRPLGRMEWERRQYDEYIFKKWGIFRVKNHI